MKTWLRSEKGRHLTRRVVVGYMNFVHATGRWTAENAGIPAAFWETRKPFILAFWHGRLLMMPMAWSREAPMNMLISGHSDGRIIADAIKMFGLHTITGSRSKGGTAALRAMLRSLKEGANVGVTPDGPRGPAMRASAGIIAAAKLSGVPIIPLSYATSHRIILASWDRFHLALPFSKGVFLWGDPISVPLDADETTLEALRLDLERSLNTLTATADQRVGRRPVSPAR